MHQVVRKHGHGQADLFDLRVPANLPLFGSAEEVLARLRPDEPAYLIFPEVIEARAREFLDLFPGRTLYAAKANPHPSVLLTLWQAGVRDFDVASLHEARFVRELLPEADLYFMHPVKSRRAIVQSHALGVRHYVCDSEAELEKIFAETGGADDLTIYVRMGIACRGAAYNLSGKFGADMRESARLLRLARGRARGLGLAFHVGSQCLDPTDFTRAIEKAGLVVENAGVSIDVLDVGGGFPVPYPTMTVPTPGAFFASIRDAAEAAGFGGCTLLAEPGRALVAEGGATLARVELRRGQVLHMNEGVFGSLFDAGLLSWQFPVRMIAGDGRSPSAAHSAFSLFGPTCDSLDCMSGPFVLPTDVTEGDWIEFGTLGAYGQAMASRFNGFHSELTVAVTGACAANECPQETVTQLELVP